MARLPDEVINRIKTDVSLVRLMESQGYELKSHGKDYVCRCPFHDDKTPSLIVSPQSNLWHCMGACQVGGSVIDWVIKTQGVSFRLACEILQNDIGLVAGSTKLVKQGTTKKLASSLVAPDTDDYVLLQKVVSFYHETLKQAPEALAYLEKRGLHHPELINHFKLGFSNRTLGYRLPLKNRVEGAMLRSQLQSVGILRKSGHEHFVGSLVVPVFDEQNHVTEMYGRKIRDDLREGTAYHLYLPGQHKGVFNVSALQASREIILCESLIDALTFWVNGFKNVTASYGVEGFTDDHLQLFKKYKTERVLIAYDRDEAGDKAAEKLTTLLTENGIECFRVLFPKGMDANEFAVQGCTNAASAGRTGAAALQVQPAQKSLALVIRKAVWLGKGDAPQLSTQADHLPSLAATVLATNAQGCANTASAGCTGAVKKEVIGIEPLKQIAKITAPQPIIEQTASPLPQTTPIQIEATLKDNEIEFNFNSRRYRVRGLSKNNSPDQLRVNVLVSCGESLHVDTVDFYSAKSRLVFIKQASSELGSTEEVIKKELAKILLKLEALQEQQTQAASEKQQAKHITLNREQHDQALSLLTSPDLLDRILNDFNTCGVVGEETNKLVGYLSCVSRKLDKPLAILIQSTSAAGKSSLMEAILALMPEEERVQYSAMTGQSLFYMGETNLKHKILAIAEEEGAHNASYALKLLQSEGVVTIASTGKNEATGDLITKEYKVEGPVMLFLTTTAIDIDEELLNRCLVLTVNESREQTRAIHAQQRARRTLQGLHSKIERDEVLNLHRNAQRLLKPLYVINPYADQLTFLDDKTRMRRDHEKYLTLIDSIALLHQYQRQIKTIHSNGNNIEYIEVTLADIETANQLAHEILGRTLDELPPQTRNLLKLIQQMVKAACETQSTTQKHFRFSRKHIREYTGWGNTQVKIHCQRLEELDYLLVHRCAHGRFEYELLFDQLSDTDHSHLIGLIDVQKLQYDSQKSGLKNQKSGCGRPAVGVVSGSSRGAENQTIIEKNSTVSTLAADSSKNALLANKNNGQSYRTDISPVLV